MVLLLGGVLVGSCLAEGGLRLLDLPLFASRLVAYHPTFGWTAKPNIVEYRARGHSLVRFETNALGFRDGNHSFQKIKHIPNSEPRHIRRIVILGDSFSEAAQVELHQTYWSLLKDRLNAVAPDYWEVMNLGVGDYGTAQQLLVLEQIGMSFRPDLVILQVFPLNDVINNSLTGANLGSNQDAYRPYLDPHRNYQSLTYLNPLTSWLREHFYIFRFGFVALQKVAGGWGNERFLPNMNARMAYAAELAHSMELPVWEHNPHYPFLFNCFASPENQFEMTKSGWAATDTAIERIYETTQAGEARLMILIVPHLTQLEPMVEDLRQKLPYPIEPEYAEMRIRQHMRGKMVPVVGLTEPFAANLDIVKPFFEGHFNRRTHQFVADILFHQVVRLLPDEFPSDAG